MAKEYDYLLKVLLVGDSDVGKSEILNNLEDSLDEDCKWRRVECFYLLKFSHFTSVSATYKTTIILLDGKRVKLQVSVGGRNAEVAGESQFHFCFRRTQIWDASGQGRFCTIIRSYSRGAQGIILVYDITNKWSFEGINRWIKEVEEHAPGIPKVLVGNRLHLAFKRQVAAKQAENYASRHKMSCFEISPLCDFNIRESFCELARMALHRNGMERIWRTNKGELTVPADDQHLTPSPSPQFSPSKSSAVEQ
jgi:Ras-related protein Rab-40